jgi:ABC-type uncharacterized transport system involved in gliding motility auxiliary subunit
MKTTHPVTRAAFGIAALIAIAVSANWLVSLTPIGNRGKDFTENKIHTLSEGTRSILGELDTPVVIRYYASRNTDYMPEEMKLHMRRVDDLLKEYVSIAKDGKLRIENLDPEPDTDAEDSANLDGMNGQRLDDQNLYFGIAVACLDKTSVIPFLDPRQETLLEYQLSKAIAEVSTARKPVIGVMSALDLAGGPAMMPGQPPSRGWIIYQQLKEAFELKDLGIDPNEIKAVLMIHPAGITPAAEFAIDQYLLQGGTVVACLDAFSLAAQMTGGGNPMMGMPGTPTSSTLPTLLPAWGVSFESTQVLGDLAHATMMGNNQLGLAVLTLPQEAMPQKDNIITKELGSITFLLPGAFTLNGAAGVSTTNLVKSSTQAGFVDSERASRLDPALTTSLRPSGTAYSLVSHLSGTFKTAFPSGKPSEQPAEESTEEAAEGEAKEEPKKDESLKQATTQGNVFLIGDVDAFYDQFAYDPRMLQMGFASPVNGNSVLLLNLLDQAVGSKHLIGTRSRAAIRRPFTRIQEMEAEFNKKRGTKIEEIEKKQAETEKRITELQAQREESNNPYATPEQEAEIRKFERERIAYAKSIREEQKELRREKDKLAGKITLLNVAAMPLLVILLGFGLFLKRRNSTRAR